MMEHKKPELSANLKRKINELFSLLKTRSYEKEELKQHFKTGERQVRDMISILAKLRPVISTSDQSGYKIAMTREDVAACLHQIKENEKRAKEILLRNEPCEEFIRRWEIKEDE